LLDFSVILSSLRLPYFELPEVGQIVHISSKNIFWN